MKIPTCAACQTPFSNTLSGCDLHCLKCAGRNRSICRACGEREENGAEADAYFAQVAAETREADARREQLAEAKARQRAKGLRVNRDGRRLRFTLPSGRIIDAEIVDNGYPRADAFALLDALEACGVERDDLVALDRRPRRR